MAQQLYRTLTGQSQQSAASKDVSMGATLSPQPTSGTGSGVLNHLTEAQATKLVQFKEKLEKDGWWNPEGVNGKPTHDDGTLLRYLRARKFDVNGAYGQFTDTEKWMKEQKVEELYEHFDVEFYERARLMYPQWTGHRDKRGIPIYVYAIKNLDSKNVSNYQKDSDKYKKQLPNHKSLSTPPQMLPLFALYHNLLNFVLPLCSTLERPHPETPVTNSTNIVDISGVSLRQFWNLKNHMQDASVLATAHYPETLDRIYIIGAPSFFPTVWSWIKRWFDPVTVSKIFILGQKEVKPTLEKFMHPKDFPKKYGGELDWEWGSIPHLDEETRAALEKDGHKGWVKGPALWLDHERVVVGSEDGKLRRSDQEIAEKKPIVYAADYTEEPVHPNKRASSISSKGVAAANAANGHLKVPGTEPLTEVSTAEDPASTLNAATAAAAPVAVTSLTVSEVKQQPASTTTSQSPPLENVRTSPMGDSQVHVPDEQAGLPGTTVEYISNDNIPATNPTMVAPTEPAPAHEPTEPAQTLPVAAPTTNGTTIAVDPHPAGHIQPGPLPAHTVALNKTIAKKLEGESISVIPADANGALPHPEIVTASDPAKGLVIEADKLNLEDKKVPESERPQVERFVTALEF